MRGQASPTQTARFDFLIGTNASEQAQAIARQCVRYLSEQKCSRLGVIFPGAGALPRLVASALAQLEIPHNDGLAHMCRGFSNRGNGTPGLNCNALHGSSRSCVFCMPVQRSRSSLHSKTLCARVSAKSLSMILKSCASSVRRRHKKNFSQSHKGCANLSFFRCAPTLAQFLETTFAALDQFDWRQQKIEIASFGREWSQRSPSELSRALFLRWLGETAATFGAARCRQEIMFTHVFNC